ncbi:ATP-grasp ribosomal peptide maturase [Streptosporangium sp. NPDC049078]|uniref:ATP-grasp ribosomal peptide maturase n=1 Tax=Streptosporangium sp. NPDC049078 TaxID=3155767 RepID=UPI00344780CE
MLVITSAEDVTADVVISALNERRVHVARIDPADIGPELMFSAHIGDHSPAWGGRLRTPSRDIALEDVWAVYYRRPSPWRFEGLEKQTREFAVAEARHGLSGLLYNLPNCRYVNHPTNIGRADFKVAQLQAAARFGLKIPRSLVTNDVTQARKFVSEPAIYKSFRGAPTAPEGNVAAIWTQRITPRDLDDSLSMTAQLFQEEVHKIADARVTVIGRAVFASSIITPDGALDWRSGDWDELVYEPIAVPESIRDRLYEYLDHFGLVFGCFDFAIGAGDGSGQSPDTWTFIECNPNGQWGWLPDSNAMAEAFADVLLEGWGHE